MGIDAAVYWDDRADAIAGGVINAGVSERFIRLVCGAIRRVVHNQRRVDRLLACNSLEEQRDLFQREWDTRAWHALFALLLNRWTMSRAYDPGFFAKVGRSNFAEHFRRLADHALTNVPITDNYFLHQMFTGHYPVEQPEGVPPYLGERGHATIADRRGRLLLVDGSVTDHLKTLPDASINAFALSNVCEWLDEKDIAELFAQVERTAAPGARVVFRNFVGWTDLPAGTRLREVPDLGAKLLEGDRSATQSRVVVCTVGARQ
jgi:S-adenosylmethionine-diacylglycerol 3-amino-3-carboxypropyl transferase